MDKGVFGAGSGKRTHVELLKSGTSRRAYSLPCTAGRVGGQNLNPREPLAQIGQSGAHMPQSGGNTWALILHLPTLELPQPDSTSLSLLKYIYQPDSSVRVSVVYSLDGQQVLVVPT